MAEPSITRRAVHKTEGSNLPIHRIVIHATCPGRVPYPAASAKGTASGTARYFQDPASGGSAHYIYDAAGGAEHCLPDNAIAWHAPPNSHSIGIEICGQSFYSREQWLSPAVWPAVAAAAARTRELCDRHGVPVRRLSVADLKAGREGICGHVDVSDAFRQTDHSDPGRNFPWDEFMAAVCGDTQKEDQDMPKYVSVGVNADQKLTASQWKTIVWDKEYADADHQHAGDNGVTVLRTKSYYSLAANITLSGTPAGTPVQMRLVEADQADTSKYDIGPVLDTTVGESGAVHLAVPADTMGDKRFLRVQVKTPASGAAVTGGACKVLYWPL